MLQKQLILEETCVSNTKPKSIKYKTQPYLTQNPTTFTSNWGNNNKSN